MSRQTELVASTTECLVYREFQLKGVQFSRGAGFHSVKFFSKLNYFIFGYFDPTNNFFDTKNEYFLG